MFSGELFTLASHDCLISYEALAPPHLSGTTYRPFPFKGMLPKLSLRELAASQIEDWLTIMCPHKEIGT